MEYLKNYKHNKILYKIAHINTIAKELYIIKHLRFVLSISSIPIYLFIYKFIKKDKINIIRS